MNQDSHLYYLTRQEHVPVKIQIQNFQEEEEVSSPSPARGAAELISSQRASANERELMDTSEVKRAQSENESSAA